MRKFLLALFNRPSREQRVQAVEAWRPREIDQEPKPSTSVSLTAYEAAYEAWLLRQQTRITTAFGVDFSSPRVDVPRCPPETCKYCDELPTESVGNFFLMKPTTIGEQNIPEHQRLLDKANQDFEGISKIEVTYDDPLYDVDKAYQDFETLKHRAREYRSLRERDAEPRRVDVTYDGKPWPPLTHMVVTVVCAHCGNIERPCKCDRIRYGVTLSTMAMDLVEIDWQSEGFNFVSELRAENKRRMS